MIIWLFYCGEVMHLFFWCFFTVEEQESVFQPAFTAGLTGMFCVSLHQMLLQEIAQLLDASPKLNDVVRQHKNWSLKESILFMLEELFSVIDSESGVFQHWFFKNSYTHLIYLISVALLLTYARGNQTTDFLVELWSISNNCAFKANLPFKK